MTNQLLVIILSLSIGTIIGYQIAKWRWYGKINILLWEFRNPKIQ